MHGAAVEHRRCDVGIALPLREQIGGSPAGGLAAGQREQGGGGLAGRGVAEVVPCAGHRDEHATLGEACSAILRFYRLLYDLVA